MSYDLHSHSHFSDGLHAPETVVDLAFQAGVTHLALTDHDTLSGLPFAAARAAELGINLISGIELSADFAGDTVHIVGLNVDTSHPDLLQLQQDQTAERQVRARAICDRLASLKIENFYEKAMALTPVGVVGRLHLARVLMNEGLCSHYQMAFKRYLGRGKPGYVSTEWISLEMAVSVIRAAGGLAVLAHPKRYKLTSGRLSSLLRSFARLGDGLEVLSAKQPAHETRYLAEASVSLGLLASQGSDFHGGEHYAHFGCMPSLPTACVPIWTRWS